MNAEQQKTSTKNEIRPIFSLVLNLLKKMLHHMLGFLSKPEGMTASVAWDWRHLSETVWNQKNVKKKQWFGPQCFIDENLPNLHWNIQDFHRFSWVFEHFFLRSSCFSAFPDKPSVAFSAFPMFPSYSDSGWPALRPKCSTFLAVFMALDLRWKLWVGHPEKMLTEFCYTMFYYWTVGCTMIFRDLSWSTFPLHDVARVQFARKSPKLCLKISLHPPVQLGSHMGLMLNRLHHVLCLVLLRTSQVMVFLLHGLYDHCTHTYLCSIFCMPWPLPSTASGYSWTSSSTPDPGFE